MNLHQEHHFEREICAHLAANGWLYAEGDAALFDRTNGLFLPDLLAWVEATQPESLQRLTKTHGASLGTVLADRVRKNLNERGSLDVLRRGVEMLGLKEPLMLVQFKPALAINPATQAHYVANRLRVVRQVAHSPNTPKAELDLVLFLNGIAVATAELKSDFTQTMHDAVDQYRFDRHPQPKGGVLEPVLGFPGGALVHFAVSQSEVMMTTRLAGPATTFLPFNRGDAGAAGNAVGSGSVQEKQQAYLAEIIQKVNGLFEGELTDDDQFVYVNGVLKASKAEADNSLTTAWLQLPGVVQRAAGLCEKYRCGARRSKQAAHWKKWIGGGTGSARQTGNVADIQR